jgi:Zn-dependent M28 family amino/carboxypeptidase
MPVAQPLKGSFKRTLKVAIFSCECYGLIGSFAYVQSHKDEMEKIKFMLNLDASGRPGGSGMGIRLEGRPELLPFFKSIADDMKLPYDMAVLDRFSVGSDHVPFVLQGIPAGNHAVSDPERTAGWPPEMGIHNDIISWRETAEDTIDKTRPEFVRRDAIIVARVMMRLANAEKIPARRFTLEETKKLIEERRRNKETNRRKKFHRTSI